MSRSGGSRRRVALLTLLALGGGLMTVGFSRSTAGLASTEVRGRLAASGAAAPVVALATEVETRLGIPAPAGRSVERITDTVTGLTLDEVMDLDAGGTPTGISRFDLGGQLVSSVRLGFVSPAGPSISAGSAAGIAAGILTGLHMAAPGTAAVTPRAAGGWLVRWVRRVAAVPVPGDGLAVQLDGDGAFHGIVRTQHRLAKIPAVLIDPARVRLLTAARLDKWFTADVRADASVSSPALAWVAPNDTFGDAIPAGTGSVVRLAWIVRVTTRGPLAERLAGLELAFDAGDGTPLGGDILE
jgi:hypothetical protein